MKVSLMGYMGSGKSTIGIKLAGTLKLKFLDLDEAIEKNQGKTVSEIFSEKGLIYFRKLEREVLNQMLEQQDNFVLALGGGTPAYYNNLELINQYSTSIYLRTGLPELLQRLNGQRENRPLLSHLGTDELAEFIAKHLFERKDFYEKAGFTVDTKNKTTDEIVKEITLLLPI